MSLAHAWRFLDVPSTNAQHVGRGCARPARHGREPVVVTHDGDTLRVLSNVCTHRGALLVREPCAGASLRCPYHGRRFGLDGTVRAAPGFETVPAEPLPALAHTTLGPMVFSAIEPAIDFEAMIAPVEERLAFVPIDTLVHDASSDRAYEIDAPWTLWVENYLEGLHIPYVHPGLARRLELASYEVDVHQHCALQVGDAADGEPAFELPEGHPDRGRRVGGYYLFVFPFVALNFYPWGISLNAVEPVGDERTRIVYRSYVGRPELRESGAGAGLDGVELEDDAIIERAAEGARSQLYRQGRLADPEERAVAWFQARLRAP